MDHDASQSKLYPDRSVIEAEALAWISQLDGDDLSERDLAAFREWVGRSPAHAREINALNSVWQDLNVLTDMAEPIRKADQLSRRLRQKDRSWFARVPLWASSMAVMTLFVVLVGIGVNWSGDKAGKQSYASMDVPVIIVSSVGEQQTHTLGDGSTIILNTNSRVEIDYRVDQRKIRLLQGEALFDVSHNPSRPFLVYAGDGVIRAIGTKFAVRLVENLIDVKVTEGTVELSSILTSRPVADEVLFASRPTNVGLVRAGQAAQLKNAQASIIPMGHEEMQAKLSWQHGLLTFSGETLEEVVREVSRYTPLQITITDPEMREMRFGGVFKSGETEALFAAFESRFDINVARPKEGHVVLSKRRH